MFRARRIDGLSQQETARSLGITEGIVEMETIRGIRLIQKMVATIGVNDQPAAGGKANLARKTHGND